jgi:hypothetical protein
VHQDEYTFLGSLKTPEEKVCMEPAYFPSIEYIDDIIAACTTNKQ